MKKYKLLKREAPTITNGVIQKDPRVGGIKLTYEVIDSALDKPKKEKIIFLKPYKKHWSDSKSSCKKGEWGNTSNPLTTVWLKTKYDFTDFNRDYDVSNIDFLMDLTQVTDTELISNLNKELKHFQIGELSKSPKKLSFINKVYLIIKK